jgi:hypothetical protein
MLPEFIHKQDLKIVFLQDVTHPEITVIQRYTDYTNLGTERRGNIITKEGLRVDQVKRIPSGRGISVKLQGVW